MLGLLAALFSVTLLHLPMVDSISFVIPAMNEARFVGGAVASIGDAMDQLDVPVPYDVTVVDDDSSDDTASIACRHGARVVEVRKRNIAAVRNAGAWDTEGQVLIFVDADARVDASLLAETIGAMKRGAVWGTALATLWDESPRWARIGLTLFNWYCVRRRRCAYGFYFVVTREAFDRVGGFPETTREGEDMALSKLLVDQFGPPTVFDAPVATSARKTAQFGLAYHLKMVWLYARYGDDMYTHPSIADYRDGELRAR